jgi:YegS/Rv2252/BmrU family lipid kinase
VRILIVANANAGSEDREAVTAAQRILSADVVATSAPDDLEGVLDALDGRALVVAGGDGSLHEAVHRLWKRGALADVPIGLIPLGTGNDFARGIDLPQDGQEAASRCLSGRVRPLDLLVTDDGRVVVNASHAGLGAQAAERSEPYKDILGPAAYPLGALIAGVTEQGAKLTVTLDGHVISDGPTLMVGIANGPFIGGGTPLAPMTKPDDGLLDVVVVTAVGPLARAAYATALRRGEHIDRDDVTTHRGREVTITGEPVPHDLDGEIIDDPPRTYRVEPSAWNLLGG